MCDRAIDCSCQAAVIRTYSELRERGVADVPAFHAAARVYCWHHPDATQREARFAIAEWLDEAA